MSWFGGSISSFTGQLSNLTKDILSEGAEEIEDAESEVRLARARIAELESQITSQHSEIERLKAEKDELQVKMESSEIRIHHFNETHKQQIADKEAEINSLVQQLSGVRGEPEGQSSVIPRGVQPLTKSSKASRFPRSRQDSDTIFHDIAIDEDEREISYDFASEDAVMVSPRGTGDTVTKLQKEIDYWKGQVKQDNKVLPRKSSISESDSTSAEDNILTLHHHQEMEKLRHQHLGEVSALQEDFQRRIQEVRRSAHQQIQDMETEIESLRSSIASTLEDKKDVLQSKEILVSRIADLERQVEQLQLDGKELERYRSSDKVKANSENATLQQSKESCEDIQKISSLVDSPEQLSILLEHLKKLRSHFGAHFWLKELEKAAERCNQEDFNTGLHNAFEYGDGNLPKCPISPDHTDALSQFSDISGISIQSRQFDEHMTHLSSQIASYEAHLESSAGAQLDDVEKIRDQIRRKREAMALLKKKKSMKRQKLKSQEEHIEENGAFAISEIPLDDTGHENKEVKVKEHETADLEAVIESKYKSRIAQLESSISTTASTYQTKIDQLEAQLHPLTEQISHLSLSLSSPPNSTPIAMLQEISQSLPNLLSSATQLDQLSQMLAPHLGPETHKSLLLRVQEFLQQVAKKESMLREMENEVQELKIIEKEYPSLKNMETEFQSLKNMETEFLSLKNMETEFLSLKNMEKEFKCLKNMEEEFQSLKNTGKEFQNMEKEFHALKIVEKEFLELKENQEELQDKLDETLTWNDLYQERIKELTGKLSEAENKPERAESNTVSDKLKPSRVIELEEALKNANLEIEDLKRECDSQGIKIIDLEKEKEVLEIKIIDLEKEKDSQGIKIFDLEKEKEELEYKLRSLQEEFHAIQMYQIKNSASISADKFDDEESTGEMSMTPESQQIFNELKEQLQWLIETEEEIQERLDDAMGWSELHEERVANLEAELISLQKQMVQNEDVDDEEMMLDDERLTETSLEFEKRAIELESKIQTERKNSEEKRGDVVKIRGEMEELLEKKRRLETEISQVKSINRSVSCSDVPMRVRTNTQSSSILMAVAEVSPTQGSEDLRGQVETLRREAGFLREEREELRREINTLTTDNLSLKSQVDRLMGTLNSQSQALDQLQQEKQRLESVHEQAPDEKDTMTQEAIRNLSAMIRDKEWEIEALKKRNDSLLEVLSESESGRSSRALVPSPPPDGTDILAVTVSDSISTKKLLEERENLEKQVRLFQQDREKLIAALNQKHQESLTYHSELQKVTKVITSEKPKWEKFQIEKTSLNRVIEELKTSLAVSEEQLIKVRGDLNEVTVKYSALVSSPPSPEKKDSESEKFINKLKSDLELSRSEVSRLEGCVDSGHRTYSELKKQLERVTFELGEAQLKLTETEEAMQRRESDQMRGSVAKEGSGDEQLSGEIESCRREIAHQREREVKLTNENNRLREHLVQMEESYTQEALLAETREQELRDRLHSLETTSVSTARSLQSTSQEAHDRLEALKDQVRVTATERDMALASLGRCQTQLQQQTVALRNLQGALDTFQRDQEATISNETERYLREVSRLSEQVAALTNDNTELSNQLKAQSDVIDAAQRLSEQMDRKEAAMLRLQEISNEKERLLEEMKKEIGRLNNTSDGKIDKVLMKNLIIGYFHTPTHMRRDALRVIGNLLNFKDDDFEKVGIDTANKSGWFGWLRKSGSPNKQGEQNDKSFTELFVTFLDRESRPSLPPMKLPTDQIIADTLRHAPPPSPLDDTLDAPLVIPADPQWRRGHSPPLPPVSPSSQAKRNPLLSLLQDK